MRAIRIHKTGGPDVLQLEEVPRPTLEPGTVIIEMRAAGINPIDAKVRAGRSQLPDMTFPYILGWDVAGVVLESAVDAYCAGDTVYGLANFPGEGAAYAEFVRTPADQIAPITLDATAAGALPLAALTAMQAFELAGLQAGERVLIHAAAGGVGHLAVQIARLMGAYVIGTASTAKVDFVRELGANEVIDYRTQAFEAVTGDIDVVLQSIGDVAHTQRSIQTMKPDGRMIRLTGREPVDAGANQRVERMRVQPNQEQLRRVATWAESGQLVPTVSVTFPLSDAASAHEHVEGGHTRGKVVLVRG